MATTTAVLENIYNWINWKETTKQHLLKYTISYSFRSNTKSHIPTNFWHLQLSSSHSGLTMCLTTDMAVRNLTVRVTLVATKWVTFWLLSATSPPKACNLWRNNNYNKKTNKKRNTIKYWCLAGRGVEEQMWEPACKYFYLSTWMSLWVNEFINGFWSLTLPLCTAAPVWAQSLWTWLEEWTLEEVS